MSRIGINIPVASTAALSLTVILKMAKFLKAKNKR